MSARTVAIGDPQASIEKFFAILERNHVRIGDRVAEDTRLISIGDHFDWGRPDEREHATKSGTALFEWLLAHDAEQTIIILGNHDLARVGELAGFDQETYEAAREEADRAYRGNRRNDVDKEAEAKLLEKYPSIPTAELIARDFSCFEVRQRELVKKAIHEGRAKLAYATARDRLFVHAGVTRDDLFAIGMSLMEMEDAFAIAAAMEAFFKRRVAAWLDGPLDLSPLHVPGDAVLGEGRGIAYQRPSHPSTSDAALFEGPPRRRFDPRTLPLSITQVIGHIRDEKCRKLLGPWVEDAPEPPGRLRSLATDGHRVRYVNGVQKDARMIFIDGAMRDAEIERYELFELFRTEG